ncbi:AraC family transcriptional regulator [Calothrix rhizosoleniae]|uniref:AraC family transcriptional regulator n=1 Tax=Calothrix rhizosoleniae TaxID=888997 RepID=UPI000B49F39B|nr:AraC family transcriptional regulator [Calothrix rhizosoleniae]
MPTQRPVLDLFNSQEVEKFLGHSSSLASDSANWQGIHLEYHCLPPQEVPECSCKQHLITIATQSGCQVEQRFEGKRCKIVSRCGCITIAPMEIHRWYRWQEEVELIQLSLEPVKVSHAAPEIFDPDRVELVPQPYVNDPLLYQLGLTLKAELEQSGAKSKLYADSAATFVAVHLLKNYATSKPRQEIYRGGLSQHQLQLAIDYIQAYLAEDICLDEIASYLNLSRYYFCRLFKQSTGSSPYQYVIKCRVERAKKLLKQGNLTLAEIALNCGFAHQSHFHHHFKRLTGMTPIQYRDCKFIYSRSHFY